MTDVITAPPMVLGWRERLTLPQLGMTVLKAKLDTGARSSSLHVDTLETFRRDGAIWLRFHIHASRRAPGDICCEMRAFDRRAVTDTGGHRSERWFIRTVVALAGQRFDIELNLTNREHMLFPLLLGRSALHGRFIVDPALSYTQRSQPSPRPVQDFS